MGEFPGLSHAFTRFVGRSAAIDAVADLLAEYRLVTVTGPGGVGKTRLADQVLRQVADRFADGVCAVELAAVQDAALVPSAVATALGVSQAEGDLADAVAAHLARRQLLLVLDNCEHVIDSVAQLCQALLPAVDDIRILATSREALGLPDEARYRLQPLKLPGRSAPSPTAGQAEAVTLFVERVRQFSPQFTLDEETAPVVERLVRRLDGMPLAIELAAARVESLGLAPLLDRLNDRFRLLVSTNRAAPARQQSLAAAVDWSYRLLPELEQRVFRFLSVFPGPFTIDAAEAVAGTDTGLAVLRLVDCSLLTPPQQGPDGRSRYQMLETLREYGRDRLSGTDEDRAAAQALASYALEVAERAAAEMGLSADRELPAAAWLDAEDVAVQQGLAWALDNDQDTALRLALALVPWWLLRGRWVEGYTLLSRLLDQAAPGTDGWYAAHLRLAQLSVFASSMSVILAHSSVVADALRDRPPSPGLVDALVWGSVALRNMGQSIDAAADARTALYLARSIGYPAGEAIALVELSMTALYQDQGEAAVTWARQAWEVDASRIPGWHARRALYVLPWVLVNTGRYEGTRELCEEVLALARQAGDRSRQADMLFVMAQLARGTGELAEAGQHLAAAAEIAFGGTYPMRLIDILDEGGLQCAAVGRHFEAVTLWSAYTAQCEVANLADTVDAERVRKPWVGAAQMALDEPRLRAARERGAAMTLNAGVELAVMMTSQDAPAPAGAPGRTAAVAPAKSGLLSVRERQLVALVAQGLTDAEIAQKLSIRLSTVRTHLDRIRDKSGYRRRADLTRLALQEGII